MKTASISPVLRRSGIACLVCVVLTAWWKPIILFAAVPTGEERHEIEMLIGAYYRAVAAEDVDEVVGLYHCENSFERDKVTALVKQTFAVTDSRFEGLRIQSIELYPERKIGLARVGVDYRVQSYDGTDAFNGHLDAAIVLVDGTGGWRIGKVARAADFDLSTAVSQFADLSRELDDTVPAAEVEASAPTPSTTKLPKLAPAPIAVAQAVPTGIGAVTPVRTESSTDGGLDFFAVRQKSSGQCVVVAGEEGISRGDTIFGAFPSVGEAQNELMSRCANQAPVAEPPSAPPENGEPLTTERLYEPDGRVTRGQWGTVTRIGGNPDFSGATEGGLGIADGLFVHPGNDGPTEAVYRHNGSPDMLRGQATVVDCIGQCGGRGSVTFVIRGDGRELWSSGLVGQAGPGRDFAVDITGIRELRLITTDGGDGTAQDWAAWLHLEIRNSITPVSTP